VRHYCIFLDHLEFLRYSKFGRMAGFSELFSGVLRENMQ